MDPYQPPQELPDGTHLSMEIEEAARQNFHPSSLARKIYWQKFGLLFAVFCAVWGPANLGISYIEQHHIDEDDFRSSLRLQQHAQLWLGIIATGAAVSVIAASYRGEQRSFVTAIVDGLRLWPKLWTTYFLYMIATSIGLVMLIVPGVYIAVRGLYCLTIAAAEEVHGPTAISRSFTLTRNRFWETFGRAMVVIGVYTLAMLGLAIILLPLALIAFDIQWEDIFGVADTSNTIIDAQYDPYLYVPSFFETWYWVFEGLLTSIALVANMFTAVYVYCWYRHVDKIEYANFTSEPEAHDASFVKQVTPHEQRERPPVDDSFNW